MSVDFVHSFTMDINQNCIGTNSIFNLHINKRTWEDVTEYKDDYAAVIAQRETNRIVFVHRAPQIIYRDYLVKYLKDIATTRKLTYCTLHLSVYILDVFMDNHSINADRMLLLANCCLLIAAKIEEHNTNIPKINELNTYSPFEYMTLDYHQLEHHILKFFDWSLMFPTAAHYVHYYLQAAISKRDLLEKRRSAAQIVRELQHTIRIFLDVILDDVHYMQLLQPSLLAASIIAIARNAHGLDEWTMQLELFTKYKLTDIQYTKRALLARPIKCCNCNKVTN